MVCLPFWPMCLLGINICVVFFKLLYVFLINLKTPPFAPIKFLLVLSFSSKIFQLVVKRKAFLAGNPETYPSCLKYYAKYDILFSVNLSSDNISVGKKAEESCSTLLMEPVNLFWHCCGVTLEALTDSVHVYTHVCMWGSCPVYPWINVLICKHLDWEREERLQ